MINELASWHCASCPVDSTRTRNYTEGEIVSGYGPRRSFLRGKFEARIKTPTFNDAHCDFWTWADTVNEIDIAETYGDPYNLVDLHRKSTYNLHAFAPSPNPYNLPANAQMGAVNYPNQSWTNFIAGNYLNQGDWHIYTCIWDTGEIMFLLDGNLISTQWKYYQRHEAYHYLGFIGLIG